jgi:hypothetical protein
MQRLNLNKNDGPSGIGSRIGNIYEWIAGNEGFRCQLRKIIR